MQLHFILALSAGVLMTAGLAYARYRSSATSLRLSVVDRLLLGRPAHIIGTAVAVVAFFALFPRTNFRPTAPLMVTLVLVPFGLYVAMRFALYAISHGSHTARHRLWPLEQWYGMLNKDPSAAMQFINTYWATRDAERDSLRRRALQDPEAAAALRLNADQELADLNSLAARLASEGSLGPTVPMGLAEVRRRIAILHDAVQSALPRPT